MRSRHAEIFEIVRREILAGKYDAGAMLPGAAELAARFGVSRPTVCRAILDLRREGLVVTRPGAAPRISRFALNATGALGLVVPGDCYTETFPLICSAIERLAGQAGWDVIRGQISADDPAVRAREAHELARQFESEHVAGIFFQPLEFISDGGGVSREILAGFARAAIPVCLLDYDVVPPPDRSGLDLVGIDNVGAGMAVGRALLAAGARRLAFLRRPGAAPTVSDRLHGVARAVLEAGGNWSWAENVLCCEPTDRRAVAAFLRRTRPDAIVSGNDVAAHRLHETLRALGGGRAARQEGLPDIRLAGFDGIAVGAEIGLVTCRQPCVEIAEVALQTLVSRIRDPSLPARTILLHAPLVTHDANGAHCFSPVGFDKI